MPIFQPYQAVIMARLCRYDWPGNVRQLINVTRQMVISSRGYARLVMDPTLDVLLPPVDRDAHERSEPRATGDAHASKPADIDDATLIAALLPAGVVSTHTVFCLKGSLGEQAQYCLLALLNSLVANYLVRLQVTTHVTSSLMLHCTGATLSARPASSTTDSGSM